MVKRQCVRSAHAYIQVCVHRNDTPNRAIQTLTSYTCRTSFGVIWSLIFNSEAALFQEQISCHID